MSETAPTKVDRLFVVADTYVVFQNWCYHRGVLQRGRHIAFVSDASWHALLGAPYGVRYLALDWPSTNITEQLWTRGAAEVTTRELAVWLEAVRMPNE